MVVLETFKIGHLHDGVILLLWPESFSFFFSYLNLVIQARFKWQKLSFAQERKTLKDSGRSSKWRHRANGPFASIVEGWPFSSVLSIIGLFHIARKTPSSPPPPLQPKKTKNCFSFPLGTTVVPREYKTMLMQNILWSTVVVLRVMWKRQIAGILLTCR